MSNRRGRLAVVALLVGTAGCQDQGASIATEGAIALGAYSELHFVDACEGGTKVPSPCRSEELSELLSYTVEPAGVIELFTPEEAPGDWSSFSTLIVKGVETGHAVVTLEGRFDDDTVRTAKVEVEVQVLQEIRLVTSCAGAVPMVPVDEMSIFQVELLGEGGQRLGGALPNLVEGEDILVDTQGDSQRVVFRPTAPGRRLLTSEHDADLAFELGGFLPDDISAFTWLSSEEAWAELGTTLRLSVLPEIDGLLACDAVPAAVTTRSPDICSDPYFRTQDIVVTAAGSGQCRLEITPEGSTEAFEVARELTATPTVPVPRSSEPCEVEGQQACVGVVSVYVCRDASWQELDPCSSRELCRIRPDGVLGCNASQGWCARCEASPI